MNEHLDVMFAEWDVETTARNQLRAQTAAAKEAVLTRHDANVAAVSPLAAAVLELHSPDVTYGAPSCDGCDSDNCYESEPPGWPCRTYTLVLGWQQ